MLAQRRTVLRSNLKRDARWYRRSALAPSTRGSRRGALRSSPSACRPRPVAVVRQRSSAGPSADFSSFRSKARSLTAKRCRASAQHVDEIPPISYQECLGRAAPGCASGNAIPVTADDFGTRVVAEPLDERIGRRIFQ
jgi:hypothetical protein